MDLSSGSANKAKECQVERSQMLDAHIFTMRKQTSLAKQLCTYCSYCGHFSVGNYMTMPPTRIRSVVANFRHLCHMIHRN